MAMAMAPMAMVTNSMASMASMVNMATADRQCMPASYQHVHVCSRGTTQPTPAAYTARSKC